MLMKKSQQLSGAPFIYITHLVRMFVDEHHHEGPKNTQTYRNECARRDVQPHLAPHKGRHMLAPVLQCHCRWEMPHMRILHQQS